MKSSCTLFLAIFSLSITSANAQLGGHGHGGSGGGHSSGSGGGHSSGSGGGHSSGGGGGHSSGGGHSNPSFLGPYHAPSNGGAGNNNGGNHNSGSSGGNHNTGNNGGGGNLGPYHAPTNGGGGNNNSYGGGHNNGQMVMHPPSFAHPGINSTHIIPRVNYDDHGHVGSVNYMNHNGHIVYHEQYNESRTIITRNFYHGENAGHDYRYEQREFRGHEVYVYHPYHMDELRYYNPFWHPFQGCGPRLRYEWSWEHDRDDWYVNFGYYYRPYGYYNRPSAWLTDYIISSILAEEYEARMARRNYRPIIINTSNTTPSYPTGTLASEVEVDGTDYSFFTSPSPEDVSCQNVVVSVNGDTPENLGGCSVGLPAVTAMGGDVYVFIHNSDETISYRTMNDSNWSNLGGRMAKIHSLRPIGNDIEIRAVGVEGSQWMRTLTRRWKFEADAPTLLTDDQVQSTPPNQSVSTAGKIDDFAKDQLQKQVDNELQARANMQTIDLDQKLKDPNYIYPVLTDLNVMILNPTSSSATTCALTAGDLVRLAPEGISEDGTTATMQVVTSKDVGCVVASKVMISIKDLQESENDVNRRIDEGTEKLKTDPSAGQYLDSTSN